MWILARAQHAHLLPLLNLQLHADAQAAQGVLEGLPESSLHQHLLEGPHRAAAQEHHRVGQQLGEWAAVVTVTLTDSHSYRNAHQDTQLQSRTRTSLDHAN